MVGSVPASPESGGGRGRLREQSEVAARELSLPPTQPWGSERGRCAPRGAFVEGLSRMRGNSHVRFLGGGRAVRLSCYPTERVGSRMAANGSILVTRGSRPTRSSVAAPRRLYSG